MGPTNSRGPRCFPLRLPCEPPCVLPGWWVVPLLPGCAPDAEPLGKNFFFFRPWPCCPWCMAFGCGGAAPCIAGCACAWGCPCGPCCAFGWLLLFLRRRRRRRCPCDCTWPLAGAGPSSVWGCVDSVVMRVLPGNVLSGALHSCAQPLCVPLLNSPCLPPVRTRTGSPSACDLVT